MNLVMVDGSRVLESFVLRVVRLTVSKAFVRSNDVTIVRRGGLGWLKPAAMVWEMFCSAVVVEWRGLKPC